MTKAKSEIQELPGRLMKRAFFEASPEVVAPRLLGKTLARRSRSGWLAGRIIEVEAYLGPHHETADPAAHSYRGPTPRNQVMFGPAGHAYVYQIYGLYYCMNITCEKTGQAGCILIRALEPLAGLEQMVKNREAGTEGQEKQGQRDRGTKGTRDKGAKVWRHRDLTGGPSRLCQALGLTRMAHNGLDLLDPDSPLQIFDDGFRYEKAMITPRIGIRHAADLPLRFAVAGHGCVSGLKSMTGRCIFL